MNTQKNFAPYITNLFQDTFRFSFSPSKYRLILFLIAGGCILLPLLIFMSTPAFLFGSDSPYNDFNELTSQISDHYEKYDKYIKDYVELIKEKVSKDYDNHKISYKTDGSPMDKNWFIAIHSVYLGENFSEKNVSESGIKQFVRKTVQYSVEKVRKENDSDQILVTIKYMSPEEFIELLALTVEEQSWTNMMYLVMSGEYEFSDGFGDEGDGLVIGNYISPFATHNWKKNTTSEFGARYFRGKWEGHKGLDIAAPYGTEILAVQGGTVTVSDSAQTTTYGKYVEIDHGNGIRTRYAHCSQLLVTKGQKVSKGQVIGKVGSTGRSTGNHLHIEFRINGTPKNPRNYLP